MTTFDDRENAFEAKYAQDADMQFRAEARANRLLPLWAAGLMGYDAARAEAYVTEVIRADFEKAGSEDVLRKVAGDLGPRSNADAVRAKRGECLSLAKAQLATES